MGRGLNVFYLLHRMKHLKSMLTFASAHKYEHNSQITADVVAKLYNSQDIALNTL